MFYTFYSYLSSTFYFNYFFIIYNKSVRITKNTINVWNRFFHFRNPFYIFYYFCEISLNSQCGIYIFFTLFILYKCHYFNLDYIIYTMLVSFTVISILYILSFSHLQMLYLKILYM